jgi:hypothetical protein
VLESCPDWPKNESRETIIIQIYRGYSVMKVSGGRWNVSNIHLSSIDDTKPIRPYNKTCQKCHSPAQKMGSLMFCSNRKCKTRKAVYKTLPKISAITGLIDKDCYLLCAECGMRITNVSQVSSVDKPVIGQYRLICDNSHHRTHNMKNGEKIQHLGSRYAWISGRWSLI